MRVGIDLLRQLIRLRIRDGRLPRVRTITLWHGRFFGSKACDGCGRTITTSDQMSLLCTDDWSAIRLHDECFQIWDAERQLTDGERAGLRV